MLTESEVISYMMHRGLISPRVVVQGDLIVLDSSRRNRNYKVVSERGPSYLVKQGIGEGGRATVANEGAVYGLLQVASHGRPLNRYLPRCFGHDGEQQILVLELLQNAVTLREHYVRRGRFAQSLAAMMGDAMATFHCVMRLDALRDDDRRRFPERRPWVLTIHRPTLQLYRDLSSGNVALITMIQQFPDLCRLLDELSLDWRVESLIHFDVKMDNYLVEDRGGMSASRLKMVDWEMTTAGDPCWDVGSVFSDYLGFWLMSMPITGDTPPDRFMELARYPLNRMQPAIRTFWHSYVKHMELDNVTASQWLKRAVRYSAARLLQTAFEQMQSAVKPMGNTICLLQLGLNIMRRPIEATVGLLGIQLDGRD